MNKPRAIDNETLISEVCLHLSQGKSVRLRAKGNSMRPFIHGGKDILLLVSSGCLSKGDVVLARIDGKRYVVHRIVAIRGDILTLMGDGNLYEKEQCCITDIYGTVESVIRDGKELDLRSRKARVRATAWRCLLPLRRLKNVLSNRFKRE